MKEEKEKQKRITSEKPVKIPLNFIEVLEGLLSTKPPKEELTKERDDK